MKQEVVTVGLDLAKSVFQIHAIGETAPFWSGANFGGQRWLAFSPIFRLASLAWRHARRRTIGLGS